MTEVEQPGVHVHGIAGAEVPNEPALERKRREPAAFLSEGGGIHTELCKEVGAGRQAWSYLPNQRHVMLGMRHEGGWANNPVSTH